MPRLMTYSWSSEIYGLGKAFRHRAYYPKFLPLCFRSDHGVNTTADVPIHVEYGDKHAKHFVTWNPENIKSKEDFPSLKFYPQVHPWIPYRRHMKYEISADSTGTLFFPVHSVPGFDTSGIDDEASINYLKSLPLHFQPIGVSIHMHDRGSERERNFLDAGFEIIYHGNSLDWNYVDNFYKNLISFRYLISESYGSQIAYAIEIGIPCQIISREIRVKSLTSDLTLSDEELEGIRTTSELFHEPPGVISESQKQFIESILGMAYLDRRWSFVFQTWRLFFINFPFWFIFIWPRNMLKIVFKR